MMRDSRIVRIILSVLTFIAMAVPVSAQNSIDSEAFFRNAASQLDKWQVETSTTNQQVSFPWIEQYEFRTETRDFNIEEQEYTLRVSPNTPNKRKAQQVLYDHYARMPQFEVQQLRCDAYLDFHVDWTSLYLIEENIKLLQQLTSIYEDKDLVFQKMISAADLPIDKIINHEADKTKLQYSLSELQLQRNQLLARYGYDDVALDFSDFIHANDIATQISRPLGDIDRIDMNQLAYEQAEIQKELDLEMARKKQYFDFAQIRYQGPYSDLLSERVSLSVALQLPNSGRRKLRVQELQVRQQNLALESRKEKQETSNRIALATSSVALSISKHQLYQELREAERSRLSQWSAKLSKRADASPISLLEIEERHIETLLKKLDLLEDILDDYLTYLNRSEQICREENLLK